MAERTDDSSLRRPLVLTFIATLISCVMVLGIPLSASAANQYYQQGDLTKNGWARSYNTSMRGMGATAITNATVEGRYDGSSAVVVAAEGFQTTFSTRTTTAYCRWTNYPLSSAQKIPMQCWVIK